MQPSSLHAGVLQVGAMDEGDDPKYAPIGGGETGTGMALVFLQGKQQAITILR